MIEWDKPEPREEKHRARRSIGQAASIAGSETSCRDGLLATDTVDVKTHLTWKSLLIFRLQLRSRIGKALKKGFESKPTKRGRAPSTKSVLWTSSTVLRQ